MKRAFLGLAAALLLFLVCGGLMATWFLDKLVMIRHVVALKPAVTVALTGVKRRQFAGATRTGTISDLLVEANAGRILAAGPAGGGVWSFTGQNLSTTLLPGQRGRVQLVPWTQSGMGYLFRGSWTAPSILFDPSGKMVWTAPRGSGVDDAVAGDFLHLGRPQIAVGYNGADGITLYDSGGPTLWHQADGNVWHVERFHDPATGALGLVHSDVSGKMTVCTASGAVVGTSSVPTYLNNFSVTNWPTPKSPDLVLLNTGSAFDLVDSAGNVVKSLTSPKSVNLKEVHGVSFRLKGQSGSCFAVVASPQFGRASFAVLSIFDANGKLIYEEVLPELCIAVAALPGSGGAGPDTLLVGGTNHIWAFYATIHDHQQQSFGGLQSNSRWSPATRLRP